MSWLQAVIAYKICVFNDCSRSHSGTSKPGSSSCMCTAW